MRQDGSIRIGVDVDTNSFDKQIDYVESQMKEIQRKLSATDKGYEIGEDVLKLEAQYEKLGHQLTNLVAKQKQYNIETKRIDLSKASDQLTEINSKMGSATKKVIKWGLAVFGVRSAYMGIRRIISTVRSENEEINASFGAMENFFATVFEPLVARIASWMKTIVQWANYLLQAWFGIDFLSRANEKALKGANKQAKDLKKTMAGFDEMNVLQTDGTTSGTGGGIGTIEPLPDAEIPKWLEWIKDNKDIVIGGLLGIAGGLLAVKFGADAITGLGIGLIIMGAIDLILKLVDYFKKLDGSLKNNGTSWKDFGGIITAIGIILAGISLVILSWPVALAAALVLIIGLILKNWDKIKGYLDKAFKWIEDKFKWIENNFGIFGSNIANLGRNMVAGLIADWQGLFTAVKQIFDGILLIFKGDFKGGIESIGKGVVNLLIRMLNTLITAVNTFLIPFAVIIEGVGKIIGKSWKTGSWKIPTVKYLAEGGIINTPGRGVSLGANIVGGERGEEAVLPLTNDSTMEYLGSKIAKHIVVDLTNITKINDRVIARELKKLSSNENFVMNR